MTKVNYLKTAVLKLLDVYAIQGVVGLQGATCDTRKTPLLMLCKIVSFQYESEIRVFLVPKSEANYSKNGVNVNDGFKNITKT